MATDLKGLIQKVIQDKDGIKGLEVTEVKESPCTKPGDNFMSVVSLAKVEGRLPGGAPFSTTLFVKRPHDNSADREHYNTDHAFINEATMYLKMLPLYDVTVPCPRCYHADKDLLILEDLTRDGYMMVDRTKGFDLETAKLVVKALAKFHVASYCSSFTKKDDFIKVSRLLKPIGFNISKTKLALEDMIEQLFTQLEDVVEVKHVLDLLKPLKGRVFDTMRSLRKPGKIKVVTHGDFWINNLLCRAPNPKSVKIVDLQACDISSPVVDVWSFLYSSLESGVFENNLDNLVDFYCNTFLEECSSLEVPLEQRVSYEDLTEELLSRELYGVLISMMYIPAILLDSQTVPFLKNITQEHNDEDFGGKLDWSMFVGLKERFVRMVKVCMKRGVLFKIQ